MTEPANPAAPTGRRGQRLTYLVKRLEMAERARLEERLRPLGVTLGQYTALSVLERRGGLSSAQLARRHFVTPQAMQQLVAGMERDQLIERRADSANRRILRVWLTEHGERMLAACHEAAGHVERRMLARLEDGEAAAFAITLERCLESLTEPDGYIDPPPADEGLDA
ncbi:MULTISPECIES: MarR family winged helix-turn-helix transcriptional regulator [Pseudonocardia]|nr:MULTISPECIES: MarR family transcriptional regulator [Pseudonocardia]TDN76555.1 DNA-binding MarR family transcriptional regulator [Pseudonocardia autotrophica]BBG00555.1 MarR family transcriptional regulator [Pseudonocardia autotrophica]GEC28457.1 MarR family transcriptional regulator [Pseudonocardia saturnea]